MFRKNLKILEDFSCRYWWCNSFFVELSLGNICKLEKFSLNYYSFLEREMVKIGFGGIEVCIVIG